MYYKKIQNGYIVHVNVDCGGDEISEQEYNELLDIIRSWPRQSNGIGYRLREDLTWEEYELPVQDFEDISDSEALEILLGGAV